MKRKTKKEQVVEMQLSYLQIKGNNKLSCKDQVERIVTHLLLKGENTSAEKAKTGNDLYKEYIQLKAQNKSVFDVKESSFHAYLSWISRDNTTNIYKQNAKHGYYLVTNKPPKTVLKETELYPVLVDWLSTDGEHVKNISRRNGMAQWGNPDVVGVRHSQFFGQNIINVTTIEAKRDIDNWRKDFFEAVSHSLFSNNTYYAYLCRADEKIVDDMLLYAQKFGIGILRIAIPVHEWNQHKPIETDCVEVVMPAPNHSVNIDWQKRFLISLGIHEVANIDDLDKDRDKDKHA